MTTSHATIATDIARMVREIGCISADDPSFDDHVQLFDAGYLDSFGFVRLTARIEETFGIALSEPDLFDPRFTTVAGMAELVSAQL